MWDLASFKEPIWWKQRLEGVGVSNIACQHIITEMHLGFIASLLESRKVKKHTNIDIK